MPISELTAQSVIRRSVRPLSADLGSETMLMSSETGKYYSLDTVGAEIWRRLVEPVSIRALCRSLATIYHGDADQIERDVIALLKKMLEQGLIEVAP